MFNSKKTSERYPCQLHRIAKGKQENQVQISGVRYSMIPYLNIYRVKIIRDDGSNITGIMKDVFVRI